MANGALAAAVVASVARSHRRRNGGRSGAGVAVDRDLRRTPALGIWHTLSPGPGDLLAIANGTTYANFITIVSCSAISAIGTYWIGRCWPYYS